MVHPGLTLSNNAPSSNARGLVISQELTLDEITGVPLILLPEELIISSAVARVGFSHYEEQGAPSVNDLDDVTCLSLLLAHEQVVERDHSFYKPYLDALPSLPPCAWLNPSAADREIESMVNRGRLSAEQALKWREEVEKYRISMSAHAQGVTDRYAKYFPVTRELFLASMGHVLSRSFASVSGGKESLSLLPGIDLINHHKGFDHPELIALGEDEEDRCICVSSMFEGEWRALSAGSEIFISYSIDQGRQGSRQKGLDEALRCFLNHGFAFEELWPNVDSE